MDQPRRSILRGFSTSRACGIVLMIELLVVAAGCGAPDGKAPVNDNASDGGFVFEGEDDPTIAALDYERSELLVQTLPGAIATELADAYASAGAQAVDAIPELDTVVLAVDPDQLLTTAAALAEHELIEAVRKNYLYDVEAAPNDPRAAEQSHLDQLRLADAWDISTGNSATIIAILDTGVLPTHEDLRANLLDGYNVVDANTDFSDVHGHGTAVAGAAAAASNNAQGVAGVCGDCSILPVRVSLPDGRASSRAIASAVLWAVLQGASVINISFGPLEQDKIVLAAAQVARNNGVPVVIAAGNQGARKSAADSEHALFIGAVNDDDTLADFSNTGPFVDLVAPGVRILTTDLTASYARYNGTSFSAPIASGVIALIRSVNPDLRPATLENLLRTTALDLGASGRDSSFGSGLIDAAAVLARAETTEESPDTRPPTVTVSSPRDGATVSGRVPVRVTAADAAGVADVVLSVDGAPALTDSVSPYTFSLDTSSLAPGAHTLAVVATDVVGNASSARTVRITVAGATGDIAPPAATFISPSDGATVFGTVEARALVTDNSALSRVEWFVDGRSARSASVAGTRQEVSFFWNTSALSSGSHTLTLRVTDAAGLTASAAVTVRK